ncbi:hypothetical protein Rhal01_02258 [Rubritalea halochordaticola]|uniref:Alpha-galactosidase n=1 Tax=Rubritalea halochordaticola TaxID=714537 RepID=A0ABP9V095_9BACT
MNFSKGLLLSLTLAGTSLAQMPQNYQLKQDWLLNNTSFKAEIKTGPGTITLSNGLFERVIDTKLGTTSAFNNLMTGQTIIRAVEQEGSVTIDGVTYSIGGVTGQINRAFIDEATLKALKPESNSLTLVGHEIGEPKERLQWGKIRRHAPNVVWPPKGKYLRLDYRLPAPSASDLAGTATTASALGRKLLYNDEFKKIDSGWKIRTSPKHERSSFENEGKPGEIYTLPDTAVVAERPLPKGTSLVEAEINAGTDDSSSWGPGMALVYKDRVVKFNLRPAGLANVNRPVLGIWDGTKELPNVSGNEKIDLSKDWTLRIRIEGQTLHFEAKPSGGQWKSYHTLPMPVQAGQATAFRVGKLDMKGGLTDRDAEGELVRLRINRVSFYSMFDLNKLQQLAEKEKSQRDVTVSVHYEIYDGIPALSKWITVSNDTDKDINLDRFNAETLAVVEKNNLVESRAGRPIEHPDVLDVETDMAMGGLAAENADRYSVFWKNDPAFKTQVNYLLKTPCLLKVEPARGPDQTIKAGDTFESFYTFELVQDSTDRERRGLARRKLYRTIAPWVTENPIMLHCKSSDPKVVKTAIDQAAETGFEMVILSFGSGFNMENDSPDYLAKWKEVNDYAKSKGIELGSYSLYSSRRIGGGNDIVPPKGVRPTHGNCPSITSEWGQKYLAKLYNCFDKTGFTVFENDGTYPGDEDTTARPPLQKGLSDSRWVHWRLWTDFFKHLRAKGVFMNFPDYYYLNGANKCTMGYREVNWSLPRAMQRIHTRQNIYDGTWLKTPSMGWMFVPLTQYHGGGAAATIEPLKDHLPHYKSMMLSNLALGVQACYRGTRIYDTQETKQMVTEVVSWFKKHRDILESDLVHGRRADGLDLDWMLHVNPQLKEKALLAVFNPTEKEITKQIAVPLYYAGLSGNVRFSIDGKQAESTTLDSNQRAFLSLRVPAEGFSYVVFK